MASRVKLPAWPTTLDCIAWSADNWIAVACGEQVAIITPKASDPGEPLWDTTLFRANAFTLEEVPMLYPLSFENFSLAEEQSYRQVQALAWSAPRMGKYGRCVLVVLSSNHILSLWECDGKPTVPANWKRRCIVNHALRRHYGDDLTVPVEGKIQQELNEQRQVSQRVRSFCWSPSVFQDWSEKWEDSKFLPYIDNPCQWLAVATEAGHIFLVSVLPPEDISTGKSEWRLDVGHRLDSSILALEGLHYVLSDEAANNHPLNEETFVADHIAWGPWSKPAGSVLDHAVIAFVSQGRLFTARVVGEPWQKIPGAYPPEQPQDKEGRQFIPSRSDLRGPIRFVPGTELVVAFGEDLVLCVDVSGDPASASFTSHHLDGRWDEASGLTASLNEGNKWTVNITSHLFTAAATTAALSIPLLKDDESGSPMWQKAINQSRKTYSLTVLSGGRVQDRTWGIATSPLGDLIVTASSMLPAESPAYVITSEQETILDITETRPGLGEELLRSYEPSLKLPSVLFPEVLWFYLKDHLKNRSGLERNDVELLADRLIQRMGIAQTHYFFDGDHCRPDATEELVKRRQHLRISVYMHREAIKKRVQALIYILLGNTAEATNCHADIIRLLVNVVCTIPSKYREDGAFSRKILGLHGLTRKKLDPASGDVEGDPNEECGICNQTLEFESVKWARCKGGHQFARCGLTLLAIQRPGMSKFCTVCGTQYLSEWKMPCFGNHPLGVDKTGKVDTIETEAASENDWVHITEAQDALVEPKTSLARLMFVALDVCLYCGGKCVD